LMNAMYGIDHSFALSGLAKIVSYRIPGRRFALPWAITLRPVGAKDHLTGKKLGTVPEFLGV
jgi:hypothetical protein